MLEARIVKAVVLQDQKTQGTVLMAVAEYYDEMVNIKMEFDWENLDKDWFCKELKEKLAEAFDLPLKMVDINEKRLLDKMAQYHYALKDSNPFEFKAPN
jgi:hypothetical protein